MPGTCPLLLLPDSHALLSLEYTVACGGVLEGQQQLLPRQEAAAAGAAKAGGQLCVCKCWCCQGMVLLCQYWCTGVLPARVVLWCWYCCAFASTGEAGLVLPRQSGSSCARSDSHTFSVVFQLQWLCEGVRKVKQV